MNISRVVLALVITAITGAGIAVGATAGVPWYAAEEAALRLSWSARPERLERCRELSAAEIAARPVHMRQAVECEVHFATYDLMVEVDGVVLDRSLVRGGGLRNDRQLYLLRHLPVTPGARRIRVEMHRREEGESSESEPREEGEEREDDTDSAGVAERTLRGVPADTGRLARERETRRQRQLAALAPHLVLDTIVSVKPGRVLLVTYDGRGHFVLVR